MAYGLLIVDGEIEDAHGAWVKFYDPDGNDGAGLVEGSADHRDAIEFDSIRDVLSFLKQTSTVRPLRDDGQPNRPLTHSTIEIKILP